MLRIAAGTARLPGAQYARLADCGPGAARGSCSSADGRDTAVVGLVPAARSRYLPADHGAVGATGFGEMSVSGHELIALLPLLIVAGTSIVVMLAEIGRAHV